MSLAFSLSGIWVAKNVRHIYDPYLTQTAKRLHFVANERVFMSQVY